MCLVLLFPKKGNLHATEYKDIFRKHVLPSLIKANQVVYRPLIKHFIVCNVVSSITNLVRD